MSAHWFARRYPLGAMRSGMAPIAWQGWAVIAGLVLSVLLAATVGAWFAHGGETLKGIGVFVVIAGVCWLGFIRVANKKGDHIRSVAEYRQDEAARGRQGESI